VTGVELSLKNTTPFGVVSRVLLCKFRADSIFPTSSGYSKIYGINMLVYAFAGVSVSMALNECTLNPSNLLAPSTVIYPRTGDGTMTVGSNTVLVGQCIALHDLGSHANAQVAQRINFTFSPPVQTTKESFELYMANCDSSGSTITVGIWNVQVLVGV